MGLAPHAIRGVRHGQLDALPPLAFAARAYGVFLLPVSFFILQSHHAAADP